MFPQILILISLLVTTSVADYVNKTVTRPGRFLFYPKNSVFRKKDLIDKGCVVFINTCPTAYKRDLVCGRHYDGQYKTFNSYCDLEYENCNGWRQWSMVKRERC